MRSRECGAALAATDRVSRAGRLCGGVGLHSGRRYGVTKRTIGVSLIDNEQTKLTATALNNVAVAFGIAGFVGPAVAFGFGASTLPDNGITVAMAICWVLIGTILHLCARLLLLRLRE